jgi:hypothetical protein
MMSAMSKDVFFWNGYVENPCIAVGIIQISCLVTEIRPLPVYVRHIVFSDIGGCQPCQITYSCPWINPKHPYCVLEFLKYVIRCQKNLTNENCYISAHIPFESTISGRHIGKIVEDIRKKNFVPCSQQSFRKIHQITSMYLSPFRSYVSKSSLGDNFTPLGHGRVN